LYLYLGDVLSLSVPLIRITHYIISKLTKLTTAKHNLHEYLLLSHKLQLQPHSCKQTSLMSLLHIHYHVQTDILSFHMPLQLTTAFWMIQYMTTTNTIHKTVRKVKNTSLLQLTVMQNISLVLPFQAYSHSSTKGLFDLVEWKCIWPMETRNSA